MTKRQAISTDAFQATYMMPIYVALQAGVEFKEKKRVPFLKVCGIENMIFLDNKNQKPN